MPNQMPDMPMGFGTMFNTREPNNAVAVLALPAAYVKRVDVWFDTHACTSRDAWIANRDKNPTATIGGAFGASRTWILTPSTVGMMISVECSCGEKLEDVTELADNW